MPAQVVEQLVRPTGLVDPEVEVRPAGAPGRRRAAGDPRARRRCSERVLITTLTKRMAEQLTDYLTDNGVKVRYLHSDIDTVERVEILRDLRLGAFDVLVGINLLREGLDLPEVCLVAILDADKEGFLRSERSLIQTIGRAARNLNGRAILYADRITDSMRRAIDETERRRTRQIAHNLAQGITPRSVSKQVRDLIDGVVSRQGGQGRGCSARRPQPRSRRCREKDLGKRIKALEKQMLEHARNLEFEKAARVRDQLALLREQAFGGAGHDVNVVPLVRRRGAADGMAAQACAGAAAAVLMVCMGNICRSPTAEGVLRARLQRPGWPSWCRSTRPARTAFTSAMRRTRGPRRRRAGAASARPEQSQRNFLVQSRPNQSGSDYT